MNWLPQLAFFAPRISASPRTSLPSPSDRIGSIPSGVEPRWIRPISASSIFASSVARLASTRLASFCGTASRSEADAEAASLGDMPRRRAALDLAAANPVPVGIASPLSELPKESLETDRGRRCPVSRSRSAPRPDGRTPADPLDAFGFPSPAASTVRSMR